METGRFQAGIGRANITPPLSAPHAGWGAQTHIYADGVENDLWATVLAISDGQRTAVLVELDLVIISREESDTIRSAVAEILDIPVESVRVAVSHNHAGPPPSSWSWMPEGRDALRSYYQVLPSLVSGAALYAWRTRSPARVGVGHGESNIAVNRREIAPTGQTVTGVNHDGPIDPDLLVTRIDALDGSPIAVILGYTMHPTTMGPTNRMVTPDWPGHLKRVVERNTGAMSLFVQGATGDIGPGPDGFTDDLRVIRRIGAVLGNEAGRVYHEMELPPREFSHERVWDSGAPLGKWASRELDMPDPIVDVRTTWVELPVAAQTPLEDAKSAAEAAQARLADLIKKNAPESEIEDATFAVKRTNMTLSRSQTFGGRETFPIEVSAVRIGELVIVGCEGEPFSRIGRRVKEGSPFEHTWFGGYTGGWMGYIPTSDEIPKAGYEVETSPYKQEAAELLANDVVEFLKHFETTGYRVGARG